MLNAQRAAEEATGKIRWLRPDYQIPLLAPQFATKQTSLELAGSKSDAANDPRFRKARPSGKSKIQNPKSKHPWPKPLAERVRAIETALASQEKPATAADLAKRFTRAKPADIAEILQTLVALGRAREGDTKDTFVR